MLIFDLQLCNSAKLWFTWLYSEQNVKERKQSLAAPHKYFIHCNQVKDPMIACTSIQAFSFTYHINIGVTTVDLI